MDLELRSLQQRVRNVALDARALMRLIESEVFTRAWRASSADQRRQLAAYVVGIEKDNVDKWIRRVLAATDLDARSARELRELAKSFGITYLNNRTKEQLIELIRKGEQASEPRIPDGDAGGSQADPPQGRADGS